MDITKEATKLVSALIERWTAKSPKAGVYVTNVALVVGLVALAVPYAPIVVPALVLPVWVIPAASTVVAFIAKLSVETPEVEEEDE